MRASVWRLIIRRKPVPAKNKAFSRPDGSPTIFGRRQWSSISWCLYSFVVVFRSETESTAPNPQLHHGEKEGGTGSHPGIESASDW
jgi:hypothetical protein